MSLDNTTTPVVKEHEQTNGVVCADELLETLERSAYAQDYRTFSACIQDVDWSARPTEHILKAIDMALLVGAARLAMDLAQESVRLFPDDPRCQWSARVIAPAKIVGTGPAKAKGLRATSAWLRTHAKEYRGQWIAVREGVFLGSAPSYRELEELLKDEPDVDSIVATQVL